MKFSFFHGPTASVPRSGNRTPTDKSPNYLLSPRTAKKNLIMPAKPFKQIQLHPEQPDCCNECPLLGLIPEAEREFGSQETLVCLGTRHALNARIARSRKSEHTPKHPLKRWCDDEWERWQEEPYFGKLPVRKIDVSRYRDPWERSQQLPIIFHNKRGRKPKSK